LQAASRDGTRKTAATFVKSDESCRAAGARSRIFIQAKNAAFRHLNNFPNIHPLENRRFFAAPNICANISLREKTAFFAATDIRFIAGYFVQRKNELRLLL
jgi:hypothetical protein